MTNYRTPATILFLSMLACVCLAPSAVWAQAGTITKSMQNNCVNDYKKFCGVQPVAALDHRLDQIGQANRLTNPGDRDLDRVRVRHGAGESALQLLAPDSACRSISERGEDVETDPRQRDVATVQDDPRTAQLEAVRRSLDARGRGPRPK